VEGISLPSSSESFEAVKVRLVVCPGFPSTVNCITQRLPLPPVRGTIFPSTALNGGIAPIVTFPFVLSILGVSIHPLVPSGTMLVREPFTTFVPCKIEGL